MSGVLFVIDQLGDNLARLSQENAALRAENARLKAAMACPDCHVAPGQPHAPGCDQERCSVCGEQRITCRQHEAEHDPSAARWIGSRA